MRERYLSGDLSTPPCANCKPPNKRRSPKFACGVVPVRPSRFASMGGTASLPSGGTTSSFVATSPTKYLSGKLPKPEIALVRVVFLKETPCCSAEKRRCSLMCPLTHGNHELRRTNEDDETQTDTPASGAKCHSMWHPSKRLRHDSNISRKSFHQDWGCTQKI